MKSNHKLLFTLDARADLRDIRRYTAQQWGTHQRDVYDARLNRALRSIMSFPEMGRARDDLFPGCRDLIVEQHLIFYRIDDDQILVGRVLHTNQAAEGKVRF